MEIKKIPVIMDVDTCIDDAVAIILAMASQEIDLRGITVVAGNQTLDKTLHNTLSVVEYFGRKDIPVAAGALFPAFGILLSPLVAGLAMSLSSICVVSNALRLRGKKI